jgi:pimeloyl-ACP methyl ester carboxylesterase
MTTKEELLNPGGATDFFAHIPAPFHPEATGYDDANAWWLAELSRLVYRSQGRKPFLDRAGLDEVKPFDVAETECFIVRARDRKWAALVFRGTDSLQNWLQNIDALPIAAPIGRVHEGFSKALDTVWNDVTQVLATLDCPIFYAGHSLGAALATVAASRRAPRATYTYGSPLVGDRAFAGSLAHVFRFVHHLDVVTTVPPPPLYHHAGELHRIGKEPSLVDGFLFDALALFRDPEHLPEPLLDHAPINYVRLLGAKL